MEKKIEIKKDKYDQDYIEATITFKRKIYIGTGITEVSEEIAKGLTLRELDYLADSNDGSEVLLNIKSEQITFE